MMRFQHLLQYQRYFVFLTAFIFVITLLVMVDGDSAYWITYWWTFPIAFLIALTVNTAGVSGAALFVPFFILIFPSISHIDLMPITTVKLGLITESFGLSSSALAFFAFGLVDATLAKQAIVRALPFVLGGVLFVFLVPKTILYAIVAILLLSAVLLLRYERVLKEKRAQELQSSNITEPTKGERVTLKSRDNKTYQYCRTASGAKKRFWGYGIGGVFQGATGFGIGEMGIVAMMLSYIPTRIAIGTSHFIVAGTAIFASLVHFLFSSASSATTVFPWNIPIMTVPAVMLGGQLAPFVAAKLHTKYLERFISGLFIVIAIALIVLAFSSYAS